MSNETNYPIEPGIPIPPRRQSPTQQMFQQMRVGDTITVPGERLTTCQLYRAAKAYQARTPGVEFSAIPIGDGQVLIGRTA